MEWIKIIADYGALGVLTIIFFLFAKGLIVSKITMDKILKNYEEELRRTRQSYEATITMLCKTFNESVDDLKGVIEIMKKKNGGN